MQRCPFSVEHLGAISIVDGNVCVNMWETAYAFVCAGTKGPEMDNYISLVVLVCLQETNFVSAL